jgi:hypothetical protein
MSYLFENDMLIGQLIRAMRQGFYFGVETRIPYSLTTMIRPLLFNKISRPFKSQIKWAADQTIQHGWIIGRISVLFKLIEWGLQKLFNSKGGTILPWHSAVAGGVAGYLVMVRDGSQVNLKRQINMAIGVRTLYAVGAYIVRNDYIPNFTQADMGYSRGQAIWYTVLWAVVMWHWRHETLLAPGEMNVAQVRQMDFIYNHGDVPGSDKWFGNNYLILFMGLAAVKFGLK